MKKYVPEIGDKLLYRGEVKTIDTIEDFGDAFTVYGYGFGTGSLCILEEILPMIYDYDMREKESDKEFFPKCTGLATNKGECNAYDNGICMNYFQCSPEKT